MTGLGFFLGRNYHKIYKVPDNYINWNYEPGDKLIEEAQKKIFYIIKISYLRILFTQVLWK